MGNQESNAANHPAVIEEDSDSDSDDIFDSQVANEGEKGGGNLGIDLIDESKINEPRTAKKTSVKQKTDTKVKYIFPEENVLMKAAKNKSFRVYTSFGICNQMFPFFTEIEQTSCQQFNKFFYHIAVGRSQSKLLLGQAQYFAWPHGAKYNKKLVINMGNNYYQMIDQNFEFQFQSIIQVSRNLFTLSNRGPPKWFKYAGCMQPGLFLKQRKAAPESSRMDAALINFRDEFILASGPTESVEMYSVKDDCWFVVAKMNEDRAKHSGCSLGDRVYVSCGYSEKKHGPLNTIEYFDVTAFIHGRNDLAVWTNLVVNQNLGQIIPRYNHLMVAINVNRPQLFIFGGRVGGKQFSDAKVVTLDQQHSNCI